MRNTLQRNTSALLVAAALLIPASPALAAMPGVSPTHAFTDLLVRLGAWLEPMAPWGDTTLEHQALETGVEPGTPDEGLEPVGQSDDPGQGGHTIDPSGASGWTEG